MSNIKHVIFSGAAEVAAIDQSYIIPEVTPFTAASTDVFANTTTRYANETN